MSSIYRLSQIRPHLFQARSKVTFDAGFVFSPYSDTPPYGESSEENLPSYFVAHPFYLDSPAGHFCNSPKRKNLKVTEIEHGRKKTFFKHFHFREIFYHLPKESCRNFSRKSWLKSLSSIIIIQKLKPWLYEIWTSSILSTARSWRDDTNVHTNSTRESSNAVQDSSTSTRLGKIVWIDARVAHWTVLVNHLNELVNYLSVARIIKNYTRSK